MDLTVWWSGSDDISEGDVDVTVHHYVAAQDAYISGAPEDCYPSEPEEIEYTVHTEGYEDLEGDDWFTEDVIEAYHEQRIHNEWN